MLSTGMVLGWLGWPARVLGLLLAWIAQGLFAAGLLVTRRANRSTILAFGPFLVGGALASLAWLAVESQQILRRLTRLAA